MAESLWISLCQITIWCSLAAHLSFHVQGISTSYDGQLQPTLQISPKELRRLRTKGLETIPAGNSITGRTVPGEPSCEELRAMWRYYRRQARAAEITNQIPRFQMQNFFGGLGMSGQPQSFGPLGGRSRPRFRPKSPWNPLYGRVILKQGKSPAAGRRRRPLDEVVQRFGIKSSSLAKSPSTEKSEPKILLSPPVEPTPKSSMDKIKEIFRDERMKEAAKLKPSTGADPQEREYGKVVLSPPTGQDGRVANKPRELMTPFERIRFGHADELFNINDDSPRRQGSHLFPVTKRQNGFITFPMFNQQQPLYGTFVHQPQRKQMLSLPSPSQTKFEDSIVILQDGDLRLPSSDIPSVKISPYGAEDFQTLPWDEVKEGNEELVSFSMEDVNKAFEKVSSGNLPLLMDESVPFCAELRHQPCTKNSDCFCGGSGLYRCSAGQCQTLSLKGVVSGSKESGDNMGFGEIWHEEPLSTSELGVWEDNGLGEADLNILLHDKKRKRAPETNKA